MNPPIPMSALLISAVVVCLAAVAIAAWLLRWRRQAVSIPACESLLAQGREAHLQGRLDRAERAYRRVVVRVERVRAPEPAHLLIKNQALLELGNLARVKGDTLSAVQLYQRALSVGGIPDQALRFTAVELARARDGGPKAARVYGTYLASTKGDRLPDDEVIAFLTGHCAACAQSKNENELCELETLLAQLLAGDPDLAWIYRCLGAVLMNTGHPGEAIVTWRKAALLDVGDGELVRMLGLLEYQEGEVADALADLEESLILLPDQPDLHNVSAEILLSHGPSIGLAQPEAAVRAQEHLRQASAAGELDGALWVRLGEAQRSLGALPEAEESLRFAFESDPANDMYASPLLELLRKSNKIDQAKKVAERAIANAPGSVVAHMYLAERALDLGDLGEARTHFGVSLDSDPNNEAANRGLGVALGLMGEWREALTPLARVEEHTQESLLALAGAYRRTGNTRLAIEILQSAPPEVASGWEVSYELGCTAAQERNWPLATEALRTAAGLVQTDDPAAGQVHFRLGIALSRSQHAEKARQAYERARPLLPDMPDLHYATGQNAYRLGELESAGAEFERTLELDPNHLAARMALGQVHEGRGDLVAATEAYRTVHAAHPDSLRAQVRLSAVLAKSGDWDQALALLEPLPSEEQGFESRFWLSVAQAHLGQYDQSANNWETLLKDQPEDRVIRSNLAAVLAQVGKTQLEAGCFEEALATWNRVREIEPALDVDHHATETMICLTGELLHQGDMDGAASRLESLPPIASEDPRVRHHRGLIALVRNNVAAAIKDLSWAADSDPASGLYQYDAAVASVVDGDGVRSAQHLKLVPLALVEDLPAFELVRATAAALEERWSEATAGLKSALTGYVCGNYGPASRYVEGHAPHLLRQLLFYARKANRLGGLDTVCAELSSLPDTGLLGRAGLAMSMAAKGELGSALAEAEALIRECPDEREAKALAAEILTDLAAREHVAGRHEEALHIWQRAVRFYPKDACDVAALSTLASWQATEAYYSRDIGKAASLWERQFNQEPSNLRLLHNLAIAAYRLASPSNGGAERGTADSGATPSRRLDPLEGRWLRAIAYWATLLFSDAFWRDRREQRATAADLEIDADTLNDIKRVVRKRLVGDIKDYAAAGRGTLQEGDHLRLAGVEAAWGVEIQVAQLMQEWASGSTGPGLLGGLSCGPLMLERLGRIPSLAPKVEQLRASLATATDPLGSKLHSLLSSFGQCQYLIDTKHYDQAVEILTPFGGKAEARALLVEAHVGRARDAAVSKNWSTAWQSLELAAKNGGDLSGAADFVVQVVLAACEQLQTSDDQKGALKQSIACLKRAQSMLGDHRDLRTNVGLCYGRLSLLSNNADDYQEAVKLIKKALDYDPEEPTLRHWARVAHSNLAFQTSSTNLRVAVQSLWTALSYEDTPDARQDVSDALFEAEAWDEVIPFYRKWLHEDPSNPTWRHNLQAANHNLGLRYANYEQWDQAIPYLEQALQTGDDDNTRASLARCYTGRAVMHANLGNHYAAKRDLGQALEYDPSNHELRRAYYSL